MRGCSWVCHDDRLSSFVACDLSPLTFRDLAVFSGQGVKVMVPLRLR